MDWQQKDRYDIQDLVDIVRILREPGGCPWDREQTHESIRKNLIEETYEVADAIDQKDAYLLREELGDLLLQILLHSQMEAETGAFTFDDVCDEISKKLVYRHPHVFKKAEEGLSAGQVLENWEALKNKEKGRATAADRLDSVPASFPALMRAAKLQKRAGDFGFSYPDVPAAFSDLASEVEEVREAIEAGEGLAHEAGDVLFAAVNVARLGGIDAEEALTGANDRFAARVKKAEELAAAEGKHLEELDPAGLDRLWKEAKRQLASGK